MGETVRWQCPTCGCWLERIQPSMRASGGNMHLPIDPQAFERYGRDIHAFQQQHHQCYMDAGAKIRALGKNDPEFSSLDPTKRQD